MCQPKNEKKKVATLILAALLTVLAFEADAQQGPPPPPKFKECRKEFEVCKPSRPPQSRDEMERTRKTVGACIAKEAKKNGNTACLQELKEFRERFRRMSEDATNLTRHDQSREHE